MPKAVALMPVISQLPDAQTTLMLQEALVQFRTLRTAGRIRGVMRLLPDKVLYSLLQKLSSANMPAELLRMLNAMHVDGRRMPAVDESTVDNAACSLLTSWLAGARSTASQSFEGAGRRSDKQACLSIQWPWLLCIMKVLLTQM